MNSHPRNPLNNSSKGTKSALKILQELDLQAKRDKYPGFPYPPKTQFSDKTANGLTKCIITFLKLQNCQAERVSNTGRMIDRRRKVTDVLGCTKVIGSAEWIPGAGTNGTADISATIEGRSVKVEVKVGKDKQSNAQKEYQRQVEAAGGTYVIARDFQGFYEWFWQWKGGQYGAKTAV